MRVSRFFVTSVLSVGMAAANAVAAASAPSPLIAEAKKVIASEMVDPGSLQYRKLRVARGVIEGRQLTLVCGEYNARNQLGGYTGYASFVYESTLLGGVASLKANGSIDMLGGANNSPASYESKARILGICLGVSQ